MKTDITPKQLFLNCFRANARQIHRAGLALTLCLFGFLLSARGQDPWIINTNYPMDANLSAGATVTFRVYAATTKDPITYQWQHEGTNLPSATNVTLVITNVTVAHVGGYMAWITNASGGLTNTRTATLTIDPTFSKITGQPIVTDREASEVGAWCDYDGDGYLDLFVANSMNTTPEVKNSLYHNERNGSFTRVTNAVTSRAANTWGSVWADYDNDGLPDLFMTHWNGRASELFRNLGGGQFATVSTPFLLAGADQIDGAWGDLDGDGWVDLVVSTWANKKDQAFRNLGDGRFQPFTTAEVGALVADLATTGASSFADFDNDGDPDIYVSCESGPAFLYRNQGGGRYEKVQLGSLPGSLSTVGGVWADFNNDGFFDLITTARDGLCTLHMSVGGQSFQDVTTTAGVVTPRGMVFGPAWGDVDNDGDLDLFVPYYFSTNLMFLNNGNGTFSSVDIGSPLREGVNDEGAVWADYDNDGFLDLFIACGEAFPSLNLLYRNNLPATGNTNHWLKVKLNGTASNRSGIGAKIRVRAVVGGKEVWQLRQIASNGAFASGTELVAHFGLGDATNVDLLRIVWPSGNVQELKDVAPNRLLTLTEPTLITPIRPSASLNGSVTLTRTAVAGATYQWQFNGVDLASQTNRTLNLTNIVADQQGHYSVVASNATTITTNFVYLQVDTTFSKITQGPAVTDRGNSWESGSWGDYDGDGYPDLYVARYNVGHSALYHNERDGTFTSITNVPFAKTGVAASGAWADFDNDGRQDLFMAPVSGDSFCYFNNGDGTFSTNRSQYVNAFSLAAADYNRDGFMDLFIPSYYSVPGTLCRNNGDRTFTRMTSKEAGALVTTQTWGGAAWADYDDDGWLDLYTANYSSGQPLIFHNDGEGRFVLANNLVTRSRGAAIAGAWGDYDNDGKLDLCVACLGGIGSVVYRNLGNGEFEKAAIGSALGSANSAVWVDYDNDGFLDLFFTSQNSLYRNNGDGTFTRVTTGSVANDIPVANAYSYSGLWFDYDNDGFLDLYVFNGSEAGASSNFLYHNNGNNNAWLKVRLIGTASNRDGVGAKVRALATYASKPRWQRRDITAGDGQNGNQLYAHFGLGNATKVTTLRIEWPSGTVQEFANLATNQFLTLWEPPTIFATVREDGACALSITAEPNRGWQIQASSDLLTWQTMTTLTNTTATFQFTDTAASGMDRRFYRVQSK